MNKTTNIITESFTNYAGAVAQSRALVDVRDGMKPSARLLTYIQNNKGYTHPKPFASSGTVVGAGLESYIHGDSSLYATLARLAKPFAMRYPIEEMKGGYGSLAKSQNESHYRYTKMRISEFGTLLFQGLKENAILEDEWRENYTQTDIHPIVLPSLGYYNICNGSSGIAVGLASSIPQFNLKEMNEALIHMLWGRSYSLPMPDFATGGTITNLKDVKESLQKGQGSSIQIRATIEYEPNDHVLYVKEMPYSVYTETVAKELENIINENENCGIEKFLEITDRAIMEIYLSPRAQASQVINLLYKETSLKSHYGINLTMLKRGKYPQVFTLPDAMQEHLKHEFKCYTNIYKHRLDVAQKRLHILEGYLIVIANIEEVVKTIKSCASAAIAKTELTEKFQLTLTQAEAVLKLTLSRVAALEVQKIVKEKEQVEKDIERFTLILSDEKEIKKIIEKGLREVMDKYGDARRTKLLDLEDEENTRLLYFTPSGKVFLTKPRTEVPINIITAGTPYMAITRKGIAYRSDEVPQRGKKIFALDKGDTLLTVQPAHEEDYLIIYSQDKSFRCLKISAMNKTRTKLSLDNIVDAFTSSEKMTKAEYLKTR